MKNQNPHRKSYFMAVTGYGSFIRNLLLGVTLVLTQPTSLIMSVFLRKNFGERYYSLSASLAMAILMGAATYGFYLADTPIYALIPVWIFILLFTYAAIKRRLEFKAFTHDVRCDRFSYYEGDFQQGIWDFIHKKFPKIPMKSLYIRKYYEPLLTVLIGGILCLLFVPILVGILLVSVGVMQYFRVVSQYAIGRHFLLDKVDQIISDEEMMNSLFYEKPPKETRGFEFFAPRPESPEMRQRVVELSRSDEFEEPVFAE
jgi:hypothetical protein